MRYIFNIGHAKYSLGIFFLSELFNGYIITPDFSLKTHKKTKKFALWQILTTRMGYINNFEVRSIIVLS